jgi:serine/threonine-protein kinase
MGVVYRVQDAALHRDLAVKVLRDPDAGPEARRRFLEEAQIAGQLQHPGVAPVHELGEDAGRPFFAMKLVRGHTLAALLGRRRSAAEDLPRFVQVFEQVCQTIGYAHSKGVIHRDLKPSNVMVGAFGEVQVMDWGLAKVLASREPKRPEGEGVQTDRLGDPFATVAGRVLGTPAYAPPEQVRGEVERLDARADVFALGGILCQILTGEPPYRGRSLATLLCQAGAGDLDEAHRRLDGCGAEAELIRLAKDCLAADPGRRPPDAGVVAGRVGAHLAGVQERLRRAEVERAAEAARAAEARARAAAERRARRLTVGLAAAGLVVLLLGGGGAWWLRQSRLADEADRRRQRDAVVADLRQAAEVDEQLALAELHADRFAGALALADRGLQRLAGVEELGDRKQRLTGLRERTGQLVDFYRRLDENERLAAQNHDARARTGAQRALEALGVFTSPQWWEHLPDADLTPRQQEQLRLDVYREVLLLAYLQAVVALEDFGGARAAEAVRASRETIRTAGRFRRSHAVELAEAACRAVLGEPTPADAVTVPEPVTAVDYYLSGITHLAIADVIREPQAQLGAQAAVALARNRILSGLDFQTPLATAERRLVTAARMEPRHYWTHYWLGMVLSRAERPQAAELAFNACLALRPDYGVGYEARGLALLDQAEAAPALLADQLNARALADFDEAVRLDPADAEHRRNRADAFWRARKDYDRAIADYTEAIRLDPTSDWTINQRGLIHFRHGDYGRAAADYAEAARLDPRNAVYRCNQGDALREKGEYDRAIADYTEALRLDPQLLIAWTNRGEAHRLKREFDAAIADYTEALRLKPAYPWALHKRGIAYRSQKAYDRAVADFTEAARLEPGNAAYRAERGEALRLKGDFDSAIADFTEAVRLTPAYPWAFNQRGLVYFASGEYGAALADFTEAARLDSRNAVHRSNQGDALRMKGEFDGAIAAYTEALRLDPQLLIARANRGEAHRLKGEYDAAIADYTETLRLEPRSLVAVQGRGCSLAQLGRWEDAESDYDRALELKSGDAAVWQGAALLHLRRGDGPGYRKVCQGMLERFGSSKDRLTIRFLVMTCAAGPERGVEGARLVKEAEALLCGEADSPSLRTVGAALYRAGRYQEAAGRLTAASRKAGGEEDLWGPLFLALAQHRLGQPGPASDSLDVAAARFEKVSAGGKPLNWMVDVQWRLLHAEAEALLRAAARGD